MNSVKGGFPRIVISNKIQSLLNERKTTSGISIAAFKRQKAIGKEIGEQPMKLVNKDVESTMPKNIFTH